MDDNELRKWNSELNKLERKLLDAIESRCRATESFQHKLKLAFKAVDFDEKALVSRRAPCRIPSLHARSSASDFTRQATRLLHYVASLSGIIPNRHAQTFRT